MASKRAVRKSTKFLNIVRDPDLGMVRHEVAVASDIIKEVDYDIWKETVFYPVQADARKGSVKLDTSLLDAVVTILLKYNKYVISTAAVVGIEN